MPAIERKNRSLTRAAGFIWVRAATVRDRTPLCLAAAVLLFLASSALHADTHAEVADFVASMAAALIDDNAAAFLKAFDKKCPDYDKLSSYIPALLSQGSVSSSIEFLKDEGDDTQRTVELDWYLEIKSEAPSGPVVRRRKAIQCKLEKQKGKWKVTSISPSAFFAPQNYT
jgi:hypothetical protein